MKIRMTSMAFTQSGMFDKGQILTDKQHSISFLNHLVNDCGAAELMEYENKVDDGYEVKKKPLSTQSLPQVKVSRKKTLNTRKKRQK